LGICVVRLTINFKIKYDTSLAYNIYTLLCAVKFRNMELTDRELAVRWFDRKSTTEKEQEIEKAGLSIKIENLTDSDKEWIWRKQQSL